MALNHAGGRFTANEVQQHRRDMVQTPDSNRCEQLARLARAQARALGGRPKQRRKDKPEKAALRRIRERHKRLKPKEPWDVEVRRAAKRQVEEDVGKRWLGELHASARARADETAREMVWSGRGDRSFGNARSCMGRLRQGSASSHRHARSAKRGF